MVLLKISYKLRAHHVALYERTFNERTLPLIREHGLGFLGIWRTIVGDAQEYLELWEFESLAEFEEKWRKLMADPRLQEIFQITGPLVEDENLSLFQPALPFIPSTLGCEGGAKGPSPSSSA
ncbi:MAG: NIPSNAP family protein [Blastocatellia bacterium]|nr:NIPSNAP family protein [Blastocatellia bacterium]